MKTYPCIESLCEQGVRVIAPTAAEDNPHILTSRVRTSRSVASGSPPQMCSCLVHQIKFVFVHVQAGGKKANEQCWATALARG